MHKRSVSHCRLFVCFLGLAACMLSATFAYGFAGGDGSPEDLMSDQSAEHYDDSAMPISGTAEDPILIDQTSTVETNVTAGNWVYYAVEIPEDSPGWRLVLAPQGESAGNVRLYVRKDEPPTTGSFFRRDWTTGTLKTMVLGESEATEGTWYVGLYLASGADEDVLFQSEEGWLNELTWDPGDEELGTETWTMPAGDIGGLHYFRITTVNPQHGLWRHVLEVTDGEADLYIRQNHLPTFSQYAARSIRQGSDGILRALSTTAGADQTWYIMVDAQPEAEWSLFAGDLFVVDLGDIQTDGSGGSGLDSMPIEGARFYKTGIPSGTLAWRLWLQDSEGDTWDNDFYIRKNTVGHPLITSPERTYTGQGLVVPPYLTTATDTFFVSVGGVPGTEFALDSRQQAVTDLDYDESTAVVTADGFRFHTYRVVVPEDLLGWEVTTRQASGNPDLAIRRGQVPNARYNDAFSEAPGAADDSVTLVQPELGDGTFFVTVYGAAPYAFSLENREPVVSAIAFDDEVVNNDPERTGWRYYAMTDIESQLGFLGWLLELADQVPGTEIALRRNNLPGRWQYRENNSLRTTANVTHSSTHGILQRPDHQVDVWYVGVRTTGAPLGEFTLTTQPLTAPTVSMNDFDSVFANLPPQTFAYYRVEVPAEIGSDAVLGWEVRVLEWSGAKPHLYIRRDALPAIGALGFPTGHTFQLQTGWQSGRQIGEGSSDWTGRRYSHDGSILDETLTLGFGMGQPLEPGTYYVGIFNTSNSDNSTFTWTSRAVGDASSGLGYEVQPLGFGGSSVAGTLEARDVAFYAVDIPSNTPSHKLRLELPEGHEAQLYIRKDFLPNSRASSEVWSDPSDSLGNRQQTRLRRDGGEFFVHLPRAGEDSIRAGRYYVMVVSEGQNPASSSRIGTGSVDFTLQSMGVAPVHDLGLLPIMGETEIDDAYEGGEVKLYRFTVPEDVLAVEVQLENRVGAPRLALNAGPILRQRLFRSGGTSIYGLANARETHYGTHDNVMVVSDPPAGEFSLAVFHGASGNPEEGSYTLQVRTVGATSIPAASYSDTVHNLDPGGWLYYRVEIPAEIEGEEVLGWEVRLSDVAGARPHIYIRRDEPPAGGAPSLPSPGFARQTVWESGAQVDESSHDWTGRQYSPDGSQQYESLVLGFGMGQPLEPGTYYVGVRNTTENVPTSFTFSSRAVGEADSGLGYEVQPLTFGGDAVTDTLAARDIAFFAVNIPSNTPSHKLRLDLPEGHEAQMYIRKDFLPNSKAGGEDWYDPSDPLVVNRQQTRLRRAGGEFFIHLPRAGEDTIRAGRYYLLVVSEGQNPTHSNRIGTNSVDFTLQSLGVAPVHDLGLLPVAGETTLADGYEGGEVKLYRFTVPEEVLAVEVRLEDRVGAPRLALNAGPILRQQLFFTASGWTYNIYGLANARETHFGTHDTTLTVPNPPAGDYSIGVFHRGTTPLEGSYTLTVSTVGATEIPAACYSESVEDLQAGAWQYYRVEMPAEIEGEEVLGWEVRLDDVTGARPHVYIRRDEPPEVGAPGFPLHGASRFARQTSWASGLQIDENSHDWTGRSQSADGSQQYESLVLGFGMGQPLEPGTYFVGVRNTAGSDPVSFTFSSRTVGEVGSGLGHEVQPLTFGGDAVTDTLAARDIAFFAVNIPSNTPSHKLRLDLPEGHEAQLYIRKDVLPNSKAHGDSWWDPSDPLDGQEQTRLRRDGGEFFVHLPRAGEDTIRAGRYYVLVVSEGQNPSAWSRIGTNSVDFTLQSIGEAPVHDFGLIPVAGVTSLADSYEGGEVKLYRFTVPEDVLALEVRLKDRLGAPRIGLSADAILRQRLRYIISAYSYEAYGISNAHQTDVGTHESILTVTQPSPGDFSVGVFHGALPSANPAPGSYTLQIETVALISIEPDGPGSVSTPISLVPGQSRFFQIDVPDEWDGEDVLGWKLALNHVSGSAQLRVRQDQLPSGSSNTGQTSWQTPSTLVVPPLLTPGIWYVEVQGVTDTEVALDSTLITQDSMQRVWTMPSKGESSTAPGMTDAWFGDSGIDEHGDPLSGDQGIDLASGRNHLYAIEVPEGNGALLRTVLEAIGGNPDLYIRPALLPSRDHRALGRMEWQGGDFMYLHRLDGTTATEYGSWVPADVRDETELQPGLWYIKVVAAGTGNARYRLRLSHHAETRVQELALDGGGYTGQTLANTDWRYYRVHMPEHESDMPLEWTVSFDVAQGGVMLSIRDTIPPGQWERNLNQAANLRDWSSDSLNPGNYSRYTTSGDYVIDGRDLRPGKTYYLGFRASADAVFSVESNIGVETLENIYGQIDTVSATGGGDSVELAPGEVRTWRVNSPAEATRWRHTSEHAGSVQVYLRENFVPRMGTSDLWRSNGSANSTRTASFGTNLRPRTYYLVAHNTSTEPQTYSFLVDWRQFTLTRESENGTIGWNPTGPTYNAGTTVTLTANPSSGYVFLEWGGDLEGDVSPMQVVMDADKHVIAYFGPIQRTLNLTAVNGHIETEPDKPTYDNGETVQLTAVPDEGYSFVNWSGHLSGSENPASIVMSADRDVTANFAVIEYTLTYMSGAGGSIDGPASQTVAHGEDGSEVYAEAEAGAVFARWSDGRTDNPRVDENVQSNLTVTAYFASAGGVDIDWFSQHGLEREAGQTWADLEDTDHLGKGMTLREEFIAGTNPTNATSRFVMNLAFTEDGVSVSFEPDRDDRLYTLWRSSDLFDWEIVPGMQGVPGGNGAFVDNADERVFYRIQVELP